MCWQHDIVHLASFPEIKTLNQWAVYAGISSAERWVSLLCFLFSFSLLMKIARSTWAVENTLQILPFKQMPFYRSWWSPGARWLFCFLCLTAVRASYVTSDAYNSLISSYSAFFFRREYHATLIRVDVDQCEPLLSLYLKGHTIYWFVYQILAHVFSLLSTVNAADL